MRYVGLDLHAKQSTLAILDPGDPARTAEGTRPRMEVGTVKGSLKRVLEAVARIKGPFEICFEASNGYGVVYDELAKVARRVVVAHPGHLRLIYRSKDKHDRGDAKKLAKLLYAGLVPEVWVPRREVRRWRHLIVHRHRLVAERTRAKNAARALLRSLAVEAPKRLWTKRNLRWLEAVAFEDPCDALIRDELVARIRYLDGAIRQAEKRLDAIASEHPGVALVRTIPGVGPRTAEALVAWIDDPRRFSHSKAIGKYFGLVPCEDSSGGRTRQGHITKAGPALVRRVRNQAAWQAKAHSPRVCAFFERVGAGDPDHGKIAIVATMHYVARAALAMLRTGEAWREES